MCNHRNPSVSVDYWPPRSITERVVGGGARLDDRSRAREPARDLRIFAPRQERERGRCHVGFGGI